MSESLKSQITAIEKNVPWTNIYFVPPKSYKDVDEVFKEVFNQTTQAVGNSLRKRYCEYSMPIFARIYNRYNKE